MTPDRWKEISRVFKSALAREGAERAAFIDSACADDAALRQEVEALVASSEQASKDGFIDSPAIDGAEPLVVKDNLVKGQTISHYKIIEKLGVGGMGEVYLAEDTKLERKVALKILRPELATDKERMQRFVQEAKTVSSLNHPHILVIHEIGEFESLQFIATEFVEGITLRDRIRSGRFELALVLDVAIQAASALAAAHQEHVVHRDIKPENIMLRSDGYIKVLDFGIAKLTEKPSPFEADTEAQTKALVRTAPGIIVGTVSYMSPEQVRGHEVDERADIWSLGVVIYEMVVGKSPFHGETQSDVVSLILQRNPPPLKSYVPDIPDELLQILDKALSKGKELRYQTVKELQIDLQRLKKHLEYEVEFERSGARNIAGKSVTSVESVHADAINANDSVTRIARPTLPATARLRKPVWIVPVATILIASVIGVLVWRSLRQSETRPTVMPDAAARSRQLGYWFEVQKYRDGKPYQAPFSPAGEINFEKDYQVRLHISSPQAGYLYILNESPKGKQQDIPLNILFPSPTANDGSAFLAAGTEIQIPEKSAFRFDAEQGTETVWLVWSAESIADLDAAQKFANPTDKNEINDPELNRKIREFLRTHAASQPVLVKTDKLTNVAARREILVYAVRLEHH